MTEYTQIHAYCHYRVIKAYSRNLKRPLNKDQGHSFWYHGTNMNDLDLCLEVVSRYVNHCVTFDVEYLGNP